MFSLSAIRTVAFALVILLAGKNVRGQSTSFRPDAPERKWWKEAIVYQIYPRSFMDNNGDGIGDLKGIISKLDYIKSLGVNVVWLNPTFASPNADNGYDVSDYRAIMKEFGTMDDFDALLKGLHDRGIKLIMDLVVNHSSDEHEWFKQSRSSRNSPYREYYHWWNAENGKPPYRYSLFDVNHDAWMYDSATRAYYLHYFSRKQPDLNWENPKVRREVYDIMKFWADKGIDGFRLDAFQFAAKDTTWPGFPNGFERDFSKYYAMQGNLHGYLQEMNKEVLSKYDVMSVAEGAGNTLEDAHNLVDGGRHELNMAYPFDGVDIARPEGYSLLHFKAVFTRWDSAFANEGWLSIFLSNHDQARLVSRFGNDKPEFREPSSKMLATFVLTMRGTPYWYNGDELGMTNAGFTDIKDYRDVSALNEYQHVKDTGGDVALFVKKLSFSSRDNGRTPFQWNDKPNAGFTTGTPWIGVNPNYKTINEAAQEKDPNSCLNYFRKLTKLRNDNPVLVYGKYTLLDKDNSQVYAYTREWRGKKMLILLNFSDKTAQTNALVNTMRAKIVQNNYMESPTVTATGAGLRPYQAVVYEIEDITDNRIDFISDTQQPMMVEELMLHANHNTLATSLLLADMLNQKPLAIYMLGDVVAVGSSSHKWHSMDKFLDSCRKNNIAVHALLGNHDVMWTRKKGEENFQRRFPDNVNTGYVSITDSIAIVLLNSNFSKLSAAEIDSQQRWYTTTLHNLNNDNAIKLIIVTCHHAPYSNSKIVGSSAPVQHYFVPTFLQTAKCKLFITGHAHAFEHFKYSGKDFLVIGGGGGLHQPLDTSAKRIPDIAFGYKPMFHYLSIQRVGDRLLLTSHFLKPDFSEVESGYSIELTLAKDG